MENELKKWITSTLEFLQHYNNHANLTSSVLGSSSESLVVDDSDCIVYQSPVDTSFVDKQNSSGNSNKYDALRCAQHYVTSESRQSRAGSYYRNMYSNSKMKDSSSTTSFVTTLVQACELIESANFIKSRIIKNYKIHLDLVDPELVLLSKALRQDFASYIEDLCCIIKKIRKHCSLSKTHEVVKELRSILTPNEFETIEFHFDKDGSGIDLPVFTKWLTSAHPARQQLIDITYNAYNHNDIIATVQNNNILQISNHSHRKQHQEFFANNRKSKDEWNEFYVALSDKTDSDFIFENTLREFSNSEGATRRRPSLSELQTLVKKVGSIVETLISSSRTSYVVLRDEKLKTRSALFYQTLEPIVYLDLQGCSISKIPDALGSSLVNLKFLSLNHNRITTLPSCIGNLKKLLILSAEHNNLVSDSFPQLESLQELYLSYNDITTFSEWILPLSLQILSLHHNKISSTPFCDNNIPTNLKELYLNHNAISKIGWTWLSELRALEVLFLHHNLISRTFNNLRLSSSIQVLTLHHNNVQAIESSLPPLSTVHHNELNIAPDFSLSNDPVVVLDVIVQLDLSMNKLRSVCTFDFSDLTKCKVLDLNSNLLTTLPPSVFEMPVLESLIAHTNMIEALPERIGHSVLKHLNLQSNRLKTLPKDVGSLKNVCSINVAKNEIETLPDSITMSTTLSDIKLDGNPLEEALAAVIRDGYYCSFREKRYKNAILKLIDNKKLEMEARGISEKEYKEAGVKRRRGKARNVVRIFQLKMLQNNNSPLDKKTFQAKLLQLGVAWSPFEVKAMIDTWTTSESKIDLFKVLDLIEDFDAKVVMSSVQAIINYLNAKVSRERTLQPSRKIARPKSALQSSKQQNVVKRKLKKSLPKKVENYRSEVKIVPTKKTKTIMSETNNLTSDTLPKVHDNIIMPETEVEEQDVDPRHEVDPLAFEKHSVVGNQASEEEEDEVVVSQVPETPLDDHTSPVKSPIEEFCMQIEPLGCENKSPFTVRVPAKACVKDLKEKILLQEGFSVTRQILIQPSRGEGLPSSRLDESTLIVNALGLKHTLQLVIAEPVKVSYVHRAA